MRDTIVIGGALAQRAGQAGHTWQFLQYLLGFRALGWSVVFVDQAGVPEPEGISYLRAVMGEFGFEDDFSLICGNGSTIGIPRRELVDRVGRSAALVNVMGFVSDDEVLAAAPLRVFLDTDPGFSQMWVDLGLADMYRGHDLFVTVGENIGQPCCAIPTCGLSWLTTPQPVYLDAWPIGAPARGVVTSVGAWRGPYDPIEYEGETYGLRVHEFRRFAGVPLASGHPCEIALDIDPADDVDAVRLRDGGWELVAPEQVAADPGRYREYIQTSAAEFMVAKGMYVKTSSGWFSERSTCYLASGCPVIAQDTGIRELYPSGEGLLVFSEPDEAVEAIREALGDSDRHSRAARELARAHFDSNVVLPQLLEKLGVG